MVITYFREKKIVLCNVVSIFVVIIQNLVLPLVVLPLVSHLTHSILYTRDFFHSINTPKSNFEARP
jgi:hypothetical protein